ncbi:MULTISPECIES: type I-B CRISPR-associated protein Cas7/Cst2/DevR [Protofrankia]|uniref:CRISPR-associated protein DevR n=1 Tax=Protofrankia coriariae TaxID=1562887 RepID=A0ABR5F467_9ACTN|nr:MULTISPECIES: type I-B CRISPR-associated protein Cas7/Cst2/DevR [Protofrankia]KLL11487.1 CRISPR-associated protein DevR [Protofrankia coriariae]ONH34937.1 type I-B CRISPR-associated protein Cas7/Cst2/DevR [Protofrankia sp. BMG5.30]
MTYLVGKVALDVNAGAPNNGLGSDNVARVKKLYAGGLSHPYVSAQAFRRWVRDSLPADERRSPVFRSGSGKNQQAYSSGRPDRYLDDDLFGYMVAVSKGSSCQRDTVLATGTLVSVTPEKPAEDFGTMSRGFDTGANPVLHGHEHYTADLAGDVLLDLARVGTFETDGSGLKVALTSAAAQEAAAGGAERIDFRGASALRLPLAERRRRVAVLLRTLAAVRGGAKQALHYGDRTPSLTLLAPIKGGVNPFTRVLRARDRRTFFDVRVFTEELTAWREELDGPVHVGWAPGFLGDQREAVRAELADAIGSGSIILDHPRIVLNRLADEIEGGQHDVWFEDTRK